MFRRIPKLTYRHGTARPWRETDRHFVRDTPRLPFSTLLVVERLLPNITAWYPVPSLHFSTKTSLPEVVRRAEANLEKRLEQGHVPAAEYVTAIEAWVDSQHLEAPERADALLREMIDKSSKVTGMDCNQVIHLYVRNSEPYKAQKLLEEMERSDDPDMQPDIFTYTSVLNGWCQRGDDVAMSNAEQLFARFRRNPMIQPNLVSFGTMISGWGNNSTNPHATDRALAYFDELKRHYRHGNQRCKPTLSVYKSLINLLVRKGEPWRAQSLLEEMERSNDPDIQPDIVTFSSVLNGWCRNGDDAAMSKAEQLFQRLRRHPIIQPDLFTFGTMIAGWGNNSTNPNAMDRAFEYFEELKRRYRDGNEHCKPNLSVYKSIINVLGRKGTPDKAQSLLEEMEHSDDPDIQPDVFIYTSVLHGWCKRGDDIAMSNAESLFDRFRRNPIIQPNVVSFVTMISGWGNNSTNPQATDLALEYFEELKRHYRDGNEHCKPNVVTYKKVINILVQKGACSEAQSLLEEMERSDDPEIQPDVFSYTSVLNGWCKMGDDISMATADELFHRLLRHPEMQPDLLTFAVMISGWGNNATNPQANDRALQLFEELKSRYRDGNEQCKPNLAVYHTLISILARKGAPGKAQSLLEEMESSDDPDIQPDVLCYNAVLNGWCQRGDDVAMSNAEQLFQRFRENPIIQPNLVSFGKMISGWGNNATNAEAPDRALDYFEELKMLYRDGNERCKPDLSIYKSLINVLVRQGAPGKAQSLLEEMEHSDDPDIQPDVFIYTSVLHGWCKRGDDIAMSNAESLFDRFRRNPIIQPNLVSFGTMISGWGNNSTNPLATDRALEYFEELKRRYRDGNEHCKPNVAMYKRLIKLLGRKGACSKAQSLLEEMERSDDPEIQPDILVYNSMLSGWCKMGDDVSMANAEELFQRLLRNPAIQPNLITYGTLLSGWCMNHRNPLATSRALSHFDQIKNRYRNEYRNCQTIIGYWKRLIHLLDRNGEYIASQKLRDEMKGGRYLQNATQKRSRY